MDTPRRVRIFKNGRNQAIRIPREAGDRRRGGDDP